MDFSRRIPAYLLACMAVSAALFAASCGGSSSSSSSTVTTVNIIPTVSSIAVNAQQTFTANALDAKDNQVTADTVTWASSDTNVATINTSGVATGKSSGATQITATVDGIASKPATLTVLPQVSSVTISPLNATIKAGDTQKFTATAKDVNGNDISGVVFNWAIDYSGVATIDGTGLATGVSPGTAHITASVGAVTSQIATLTVQ